jgi:hypothetical protein
MVTLLHHGPYCEFGTVLYPGFPENAVHVFLNRPFRQMQFVRNFFIELCLPHKGDNLLVANAKAAVYCYSFTGLGFAARGTNPVPRGNPEFFAAPEAVPDGNCRRKFDHPHDNYTPPLGFFSLLG